jgi:NAD+ synthase
MTIKQDILTEMRVLADINPEFEIKRRIEFIKSILNQSGQSTLVLGISGGVDSCVCGKLAQIAVNELNQSNSGTQYTFFAIRLPYGAQQDEVDAQASVEFIKPNEMLTINVKTSTDALHQEVFQAVSAVKAIEEHSYEADFAKGNTKARQRMAAQYYVAGLTGGLVLGTDHSAENLTGFYTKFGDGAADLIPLFGLNKRQVRILAKRLGAPDRIIHKAPTADLECHSPGKEDEHALGVTYDQIDDFLEGKEVDPEIEEKLIRQYKITQHKRQAIPTVYD